MSHTKLVAVILLILITATGASGQYFTTKTTFTGASEGQTIPSAYSDSLRQMPGLTGSYTGSPLLTASGRAKPSSAGTGNNIMNLAYWFQKYVSTKNSTYLGASFQVSTSLGSEDRVLYNGLEGNSLYMLNDTNWTTADGVMAQLASWGTNLAHFRIYHIVNGVATHQIEANLAIAAGDTFKMFWVNADSLVVWKNATHVIGRNFSATGAGRPELSPAQISNYFVALGTSKQNTMAEVDNFALGYTNAPAAPPSGNVPPVVQSLVIFPNGISGGDTNTVFSFSARVTDDTGSVKAVFDIDNAAWDSTSYAANTDITVNSTKTIRFSTTGPHTVRVRTYDAGGGATTTSNTSFNVSLPSGGTGGFTGFVTSYYPNWAVYTWPPQYVDYSGKTHVVWFGEEMQTTTPYFNQATSSDSARLWGGGYFRDLITRAHAAGTKVLISLGRNDPTSFNYVIADSARTDAFGAWFIQWCIRNNVDGLDTDCEDWRSGGATATVKANLARFHRRMRYWLNTMNPDGVLTIAVPIQSTAPSGVYDIVNLHQNVDQILIMSYDQWGGYTYSYTGINAPEALDAASQPYGWSWKDHSSANWITAAAALGVDTIAFKAKVAMGIPFYGWRLYNATALNQYFEPSYSDALTDFVTYQTIVGHINSGAVVQWNDSANAPWLTWGGDFYTYDDENSVKSKVQWIKNRSLGGIMIYNEWDGRVGLTNPLWAALKSQLATSSVPVIPNPPATLKTPTAGATGVSNTNPVFSWSASPSATRYSLQISTSSTFSVITNSQSNIADTSYTYAGPSLVPGTTYYWHVAASAGGSYGSYSAGQSFTTAPSSPTTPATPTLLTPTSFETLVSVNPTISWNQSADSTQAYEAQVIANSTSGTNYAWVSGLIPDTSVLIQSRLNYSTVYFYRVRGWKATVSGSFSAWRQFTTKAAPTISPYTSTAPRTSYTDAQGKDRRGVLSQFPLVNHASTSGIANPDSGNTDLAVVQGVIGTKVRDSKWLPIGGSGVVSGVQAPLTLEDGLLGADTSQLATQSDIIPQKTIVTAGPNTTVTMTTNTSGQSSYEVAVPTLTQYSKITDTTFRTGQTAAISTPVSLSGITAPGFYDIYFYYACTATGTSTNITPVFSFNDGVGAKTSAGLSALSASNTANWQSNVLTIYVGSGTPSWTTTMTGTGTYSIRVGVRKGTP